MDGGEGSGGQEGGEGQANGRKAGAISAGLRLESLRGDSHGSGRRLWQWDALFQRCQHLGGLFLRVVFPVPLWGRVGSLRLPPNAEELIELFA